MTKENKTALDAWITKNWIYYQNEVRTNIAKSKMSGYAEDLCIVCYESLMNKPDEMIEQMLRDNKVIGYLLRCASFQIKSGTSPFYQQYRKHRVNTIAPEYYNELKEPYVNTDITNDDRWECVEKALSAGGIDWYYSKLLELKYLRGLTYKDITELYGFSQASLKKHVQEALKEVQKHCKNLEL